MYQAVRSNDNPCVYEAKTSEKLSKILSEAVKVLFGVNYENLSNDFFAIAINAICERFIGITILDVSLAFKMHEIEKKAYQTLTRDEFLNPIKQYWEKKQKIILEFRKIQKKEEEKKKELEINSLDRIKAINIYKQMIENKELSFGELGGSVYLANTIAKELAVYLSQKQKNIAFYYAKKERKKQLDDVENENIMIYHIPIIEMFYAYYVVEISAYNSIFPNSFDSQINI